MARLLSVIVFLYLSPVYASVTRDFEKVLNKICQKPCGVDALQDQADREVVSAWLKKHEIKNSENKNRTTEFCKWLSDDALRASPLLTGEKFKFIEARLRERKIPLESLFSPTCAFSPPK